VTAGPPPWRLTGDGGLGAVLVDGGALASLATDDLELVQHAASGFEPALVQLWLRDRASGACTALLGAGSPSASAVSDGVLVITGQSDGLRWRVTLTLHPRRTAWTWRVTVENGGSTPRELDLVHTHDVALAAPAALRTNELYVSQYLDIGPLAAPSGTALAVRQNLPQGGRHPWCVLVSDAPVVAWATDALDVHGLLGRAGPAAPVRDLPARRRQHEHTLAALQTAPMLLAPGRTLRVGFTGLLLDDHPAATGPADHVHVVDALALAEELRAAGGPPDDLRPPTGSRPAPRGPYDRGREPLVRALGPDELHERWPGSWSVVERDADGTVLSFFTGDQHVVTRAKEVTVLRPHGTVLRSGDRAEPDPDGLTTTAWMTGSPVSYLTRGHATAGRVLTTVRGYLGLHRAYGLRVLVEVGGRWRLLDLPSAFAMTPDTARWVYRLGAEGTDEGGVVEVTTHVPAGDHRVALRVEVHGPRRRVLVALHLAAAGEPLPAARAEVAERGILVHLAGAGGERSVTVGTSTPVIVGDDGPLFDDGVHREPGVVTLLAGPVAALDLDLRVGPPVGASAGGSDVGSDAVAGPGTAAAPAGVGAGWWPEVTALRVSGTAVDPLAASLPWLVRDALVHYLSPRGLEQYSGGAWGTRDVAQGPLELLLALDRLSEARTLVLSIFAAQSPDGSWPQAFGFLPGDHLRDEPPHGDVVHWPVLALGRYLLASADAGVLAEPVGWWTPGGTDAATPLRDHVERAVAHARGGELPGTHLVAYGHGDWNDSLQPADPTMARTMVSAWTVTLHHQSLRTLADGLASTTGPVIDPSLTAWTAELDAEARDVAIDLHRFLMVDGELAGYVQLGPPDSRGEVPVLRHLVHPRDTETGLRHGSLPIIHALGADLLDRDQAARQVAVVREHLLGVDGVRLFDRPAAYHGGPSRHFQRAETATFVGREIGLMYVHAHLRWCEAMARWGDAEALWLALRQSLAAGAPELVPGAARRQANTFASSSDAAVLDRAEFAARYDEVLSGATGFEGGWRLYSSGPGVLVRTVAQSLLGVRRRGSRVEIDPVLAPVLDGLRATVPLAGGHLRLRYLVGPRGHGVGGLRLAGRPVPTRPGPAGRGANPYRDVGPTVDLADLTSALGPDGPELEVTVL